MSLSLYIYIYTHIYIYIYTHMSLCVIACITVILFIRPMLSISYMIMFVTVQVSYLTRVIWFAWFCFGLFCLARRLDDLLHGVRHGPWSRTNGVNYIYIYIYACIMCVYIYIYICIYIYIYTIMGPLQT